MRWRFYYLMQSKPPKTTLNLHFQLKPTQTSNALLKCRNFAEDFSQRSTDNGQQSTDNSRRSALKLLFTLYLLLFTYYSLLIMIILTAGHTGAGTGAQCATTQFDEGAETIWLRDRITEILTNKYGLVVLMDDDRASLKLLVSELNKTGRQEDILIDLHFNAHTNPNARGTETIVSDDATDTELLIASKFAHITAQTLEIPLRCIKSESQTPHKRLAMLHLTPQSIILEVCFITSLEDAEAYRKNRHKLANKLAQTIAKLILDKKT